MKKTIMKSVVLVAGCLGVFATAAPAQTEPLMSVDIPFSFVAGEQRLPAGLYTVRCNRAFNLVDLMPLNERTWYRVRTRLSATDRSSSRPGMLAFRVYGPEHVLKSIYLPGSRTGHDLAPSKTETEFAKAAHGAAGAAMVRAIAK